MEKHLEKLTKITVAAAAGFAGAAVVSNISPVHADEVKDQVVDTKPQPMTSFYTLKQLQQPP